MTRGATAIVFGRKLPTEWVPRDNMGLGSRLLGFGSYSCFLILSLECKGKGKGKRKWLPANPTSGSGAPLQ